MSWFKNPDKDMTGAWLMAGASLLLVALAATQGLVSYYAQKTFIFDVKHDMTASNLEALGLDAGSVIFALLALALARVGRKAIAERFLNLACAAGSLVMNVLSAGLLDLKTVAVFALPALLYIAASDRLIAAIRVRALAGRESVDKTSPLKILKTVSLWTLRLPLAPWSTLKTLRQRVLNATDVGGPVVVPVTADEEPETDDTEVIPVEEIRALNALPTQAAKVRTAVLALGESATPADVYEWLTLRDQGVAMASINSTISRDRKPKPVPSKTKPGIADEAIVAEPVREPFDPTTVPATQHRLVRA